MPTNWPPAGIPPWDNPGWMSTPRWGDAFEVFINWHAYGDPWFTWRNPSQSERNQWFSEDIRCDEGHAITPIMVVSPDGQTAWPAGYCQTPHTPGNPRSRAVFAPFEPWYLDVWRR